MNKREKLTYVLIVFGLIVVIVNMGAINNFLSFTTDKTVDLNHSNYIVPEAWNTTSELNTSGEAKTLNGITNGYIVFDVWEDWPEDHISSISRDKLASMENGRYQTVNTSNIDLGGKNVSREYFSNPSRDTETQWDHMGVVYVFNKEDCNYAIEAHYFTTIDYNNESYTREIDDRVEDMMSNMLNKDYNAIFSYLAKTYNYISNLN